MPDGAPIRKVENTKKLGAEVCLVPGTYDDAHDKAVELQEETGMTFIHPYDDTRPLHYCEFPHGHKAVDMDSAMYPPCLLYTSRCV